NAPTLPPPELSPTHRHRREGHRGMTGRNRMVLSASYNARARLAARGETPAAFGRRCIPADCVAPPSHIPDMLGRRALGAGRLAALGATLDFHHGPLGTAGPAEQPRTFKLAFYNIRSGIGMQPLGRRPAPFA